MHRTAVASTLITQVGYDQDSQTLEIMFSTESIYQFFNVPSSVHDELMSAPSKEECYSSKIGNRFPYLRIK